MCSIIFCRVFFFVEKFQSKEYLLKASAFQSKEYQSAGCLFPMCSVAAYITKVPVLRTGPPWEGKAIEVKWVSVGKNMSHPT